jgi:hypothetical protein
MDPPGIPIPDGSPWDFRLGMDDRRDPSSRKRIAEPSKYRLNFSFQAPIVLIMSPPNPRPDDFFPSRMPILYDVIRIRNHRLRQYGNRQFPGSKLHLAIRSLIFLFKGIFGLIFLCSRIIVPAKFDPRTVTGIFPSIAIHNRYRSGFDPENRNRQVPVPRWSHVSPSRNSNGSIGMIQRTKIKRRH